MLQLYIDLALSRLARHADSYTAIQLYTLYSIQHYTQPPSAYMLLADFRKAQFESATTSFESTV